MTSCEFITDTATMCVYDLAALRHRLVDDADWWSIPDEELLEVSQGNAAFVGLGEDGKYEVVIEKSLPESDLEVRIHCPSGRIFVGAAEEVTSDDLEPECVRGGTFLNLTTGIYRVAVKRLGVWKVGIAFTLTSDLDATNSFSDLLKI